MNQQNELPTGRLTILGVHLYAPAYPNVKFVIDLVRRNESLCVLEINQPMFREHPIAWGKRGTAAQFLQKVLVLARALYSHANIFLRYWLGKKSNVVYVPYPALGVLTIFSLLPTSWRPKRLIADAFISIYDTAVVDRELIAEDALPARALKAIERRAYRTATQVTVDTNENRSHYADLFALPESKFAVAPLATDEKIFTSSSYTGQASSCHVVFVGTFVPLQGTDVIARAIVKLKDRDDIRFTIIGTGQAATEFSHIVGDKPPKNLTWIRDWQDSHAVARHVESADICLGIFSDGPKAQRVWPYKNYAYMTVGRALVTADTKCTRRMLATVVQEPFATIPPGDSTALAEKIIQLADEPTDRERLARNARRYYDEYLANEIVDAKLINGLFPAVES
jgi:glycosyltransferase involved in cell wall biosynthesis